MHIHIRTSVPGIQKLFSFLFSFFFVFVFFLFSSLSVPRCRVCPRRRTRGKRRRRTERRQMRIEEADEVRIEKWEGEGIGNRRAIRETQRKDSITSYKESKPSGEINKQPRLLALRRRRRRRGGRGTGGEREKKGNGESLLCGKREKQPNGSVHFDDLFLSFTRYVPFLPDDNFDRGELHFVSQSSRLVCSF